ncbi:hypothetical protein T459_08848 [Capsicum annuum]|uniref:Uncharacterized protein n=1 Tax=Capsicum annuum TaxID=4072 RepID=A0A2G2ZXM5_CAPAN|nr:hypothetical protein T459_08848 [Capsicum annuum]
MKKLRDKAASKSKKSSSKASKKKFDDSGRSRLPKCVGTIAEEFGDFSTVPPREILIKAGLALPESPEQPLKRRKTVTFQQDSPVVMDDDTSTRDRSVHHVSGLYSETQKNTTDKGQIGVSPQSHQHKSVPSSYTQLEGTCKSSLDGCECNAKEDGHEVDLKKQKCTDMEDVQAAVDSILFGLSTPSTTKSLDFGSSNKMTESQWDLPDSQIPPDFPDAQVRELEASKAKKKKSRILRSPYITKYGSRSKDSGDSDKEEKLKYAFDGNEMDNHYRVNASGLGYPQLDFVVAHPQSKNWFYLISKCKTCQNDEILAVIVWKERLICVYDSLSSKRKKEPPIEIQKLAVMLSTYLSDNGFYEKTERIDWPPLEAYKGKLAQQTGLVNEILFDVDYVQNIPQ